MSRRPMSVIGVLAVGLILVAGLIVTLVLSPAAPAAHAQPPPTGTPQPMHHMMHPLPPELAFLGSMTPEQRFDHTLSGQTTFQNPQGQTVVLNEIPGKIDTVAPNAVTITQNGSTATRSFNVTSSTWIVSRPHQGTVSAFKQGDRVVVYVIGTSTDATAIVEPAYWGSMSQGLTNHPDGMSVIMSGKS